MVILSRRAGLSLVKSTLSEFSELLIIETKSIKREAAMLKELAEFPHWKCHTAVHSDRFLLGEMKTAQNLKCRKRKMQGICMQSTWNHADIFRVCKGELLYFVQALDLASYFALKLSEMI